MDSKSVTDNQILELICSRRTCYKFLDKDIFPVQQPLLNQCLKAATHAPNHKLTQPWKFWVLGAQMKNALGHIYADSRARKKSISNPECYDVFYEKGKAKFANIPTVILVGQTKHEDEIVSKEDYAACACAIQNFQLMAWQLKIGVQWSTGPILKDSRTFETLGIAEDEIELIGALYIGNIDGGCEPNPNLKRKRVEEVTVYTD